MLPSAMVEDHQKSEVCLDDHRVHLPHLLLRGDQKRETCPSDPVHIGRLGHHRILHLAHLLSRASWIQFGLSDICCSRYDIDSHLLPSYLQTGSDDRHTAWGADLILWLRIHHAAAGRLRIAHWEHRAIHGSSHTHAPYQEGGLVCLEKWQGIIGYLQILWPL